VIPLTNEVRECLDQVGEALDNALLLVDHQGRVHVQNRAARELLGISTESLDLETGASGWHPAVRDLLARLPSEGSATEVYLGGPVPVVLEGHALHRDGRPWGGIVVGRSGLGGLPSSAVISEAELAQEIKNALQTVVLNLYIVRKWAVALPFIETQTLARLDAIAAEMQRLDALAESFTPSPARLRLGEEAIDLRQLFDEIGASLAPAAHDARIRITWQIPEDLPPIPGDPRLLSEALLSLLGSRLEQMPPDDAIEITAGMGTDHVFVMLRDSGAGLAQAAGPGDRLGGGLDLGRRALGIVDYVVRGHGGTAEAFSTAGLGTTFLVKLPLGRG